MQHSACGGPRAQGLEGRRHGPQHFCSCSAQSEGARSLRANITGWKGRILVSAPTPRHTFAVVTQGVVGGFTGAAGHYISPSLCSLSFQASTSTPRLSLMHQFGCHPAPAQELNPNVAMVAAGLTGGVFAAACSHPFDTAKTRMQVGADGCGDRKAKQLVAGIAAERQSSSIGHSQPGGAGRGGRVCGPYRVKGKGLSTASGGHDGACRLACGRGI